MSDIHEAFAAALFAAVDRGITIEIWPDMRRNERSPYATIVGWREDRMIVIDGKPVYQRRGNHCHLVQQGATDIETVQEMTTVLKRYATDPLVPLGEWE